MIERFFLMNNFRVLRNFLYVKKVKYRIQHLVKWALVLKPKGEVRKFRLRYFILKKLNNFFFFPFFTNFFLVWNFVTPPVNFLRYYNSFVFFDYNRLSIKFFYLPLCYFMCLFLQLFSVVGTKLWYVFRHSM